MRQIRPGFTLIEMMLACFIFLLCMGVLASTFSRAVKTYFQGNERLLIQQKYRTALDVMSAELRACYDNDVPPGGDLVITPGPLGGSRIEFHKVDARKYPGLGNQAIIVSYYLNGPRIMRNDSTIGGTVLSTTEICDKISSVAFLLTQGNPQGNSPIIRITITGLNPTTSRLEGTYQTSVTLRSNVELLGVQGMATGKKEPRETSTFFHASP
jgi:prepilin-type N-terminal cleavage/methylation domain-containing protein